uniref:Uncharacterized protein n=1 Tax=Glossina palpalis gambiensis TaxID=67801 RepID=A0A1B0B1R8_9MUSC
MQASIEDALSNAHHCCCLHRRLQYWINFNKSYLYETTIGEIIDNPDIVFVDKQSIIEWALRNLKVILEEAEPLGRMTRTDLFVTTAIIKKMPSLTLLGSQAVIKYLRSHFLISKIAQAVENSNVWCVSTNVTIFNIFASFHLFVYQTHSVRTENCPLTVCFGGYFIVIIGYSCSLSAQFELWLTQGRLYGNITLFLLELFVPSYFELAIYGKIKSDVVGGKIDATVLCIFIGINQIADVTMGDESRAHRHSVFEKNYID